eukprot:TRINITY_DN6168_c0_g4_i1.p1 TRINITY_DN6168_c0_g4~~TRINITY_DN6168_c0_g4_i1.p1  ORF type:complete len:464 (+),score=103.90 TRINITY_DN6168_c0_g4_i1:233-1624(+)
MRIGVIGRSSNHKYRHCSFLATKPFIGVDYLVLGNVFNTTNVAPKDLEIKVAASPAKPDRGRMTGHEALMNHFIDTIQKAISKSDAQHVIIPVSNCLLLLDLLDVFMYKVRNYLKLHVISSAADALFILANINVEFLNPIIVSKIFIPNAPEEPLSIAKLRASGKAFFYADLDEFQAFNTRRGPLFMDQDVPSIYFVPDSTLRIGPSARMLDILNRYYPKSNIILVDPHMQSKDVLAPFQTNILKVSYCPLDNNLDEMDLEELLNEVSAKTIIAPAVHSKLIDRILSRKATLTGTKLVGSRGLDVEYYVEDQEIALNMPAEMKKKVIMSAENLQTLKLREFRLDDRKVKVAIVRLLGPNTFELLGPKDQAGFDTDFFLLSLTKWAKADKTLTTALEKKYTFLSRDKNLKKGSTRMFHFDAGNQGEFIVSIYENRIGIYANDEELQKEIAKIVKVAFKMIENNL